MTTKTATNKPNRGVRKTARPSAPAPRSPSPPNPVEQLPPGASDLEQRFRQFGKAADATRASLSQEGDRLGMMVAYGTGIGHLTKMVDAEMIGVVRTILEHQQQVERDGMPIASYSDETIRRVWIEAELRGLRIEAGDVLILDGKLFETKLALRRKLMDALNLTDVLVRVRLPRDVDGMLQFRCRVVLHTGITSTITNITAVIDARPDEPIAMSQGRAERRVYELLFQTATKTESPPKDDVLVAEQQSPEEPSVSIETPCRHGVRL